MKTLIQLVGLLTISTVGFGQFTGDKDDDFGTSGRLWYDWTGDGTTTTITNLVLDEAGGHFYFSGSLNQSGYDAAIVKSSLTGELDETLPEGTFVYDPFIGLDDQFQSVAVQSNGKVVGVGYSIYGLGNSGGIVARFEEDGSFDPTFNGGAPVVLDEDGLDYASDVAIQEDGKIVVIGSYQTGATDLDLFIVRLNSDGTPDGTFGLGGIQILDTYEGVEMINDVLVLDDGSIICAGQAGTDVLMLKLTPDGAFDSDFSSDGALNFKVNSLPSSAKKIVEMEDGSILLAGNNIDEEEDGSNGFVVKMDANGAFFVDFDGIDGTLTINYETEPGLDTTFVLQDMEILPNDQILLVGDYATTTADVALVLVNADGTIDTEFGDEGTRVYNLSGGSMPNENAQIEVAENGAIYLAAKVINAPYEDVVTFRLFGDVSGIKESNINEPIMKLYPNPSSGPLTLELDLPYSEAVTINLFSTTGQIVASKTYDNLTEGQQILDLSTMTTNLQHGAYHVQISAVDYNVNQIFIKK